MSPSTSAAAGSLLSLHSVGGENLAALRIHNISQVLWDKVQGSGAKHPPSRELLVGGPIT